MITTKDKIDLMGEENRHWLAEHGYLVTSMGAPECDACTESLAPITLQDGEALFKEGEADDRLFIIREGEVEMRQAAHPHRWVNFGIYGNMDMDDQDSEENNAFPICLKRTYLHEGDCAGEMGFVVGSPHAMTARACGEVKVFCLDSDHVKSLAEKSMLFCQCVDTALAKTQQKIASAA